MSSIATEGSVLIRDVGCVRQFVRVCMCACACVRAWVCEWKRRKIPPLFPTTSADLFFFFFFFIGTTAHSLLWPVEQCPSIFSYLPPTLSIFLLKAVEDLFLLPLSIFSWVFPFFSSLPILEWRSFWASYPPPFSLGDLTSLSFALLPILLYFLTSEDLCILIYTYTGVLSPTSQERS